MSLLVTILRAAHCRSTHHFFALDALRYVETEAGQQLADILLRHHDRYLTGAKDPDKRFRDFQNHVLHVGDGHWGGACKAAEKWLAASVDSMNQKRWGEAAYCIGVLSHYFTDPLMPLHTGSSDGEGVVHRPMEWSVCKSYQAILDLWEDSSDLPAFELPTGANWIRDAVTRGAELSHPHYERIIEIYDLKSGVKNPPQGLNTEARKILAEMFGYAITGWAQIVDRIAEACVVRMPYPSMTVATVAAGLNMPSAWVLKRIESKEERRAVRAILEEYQSTGTVKRNLPVEVRTVQNSMPLRRVSKAKPPREEAVPAPEESVVEQETSEVHEELTPVETESEALGASLATDEAVSAGATDLAQPIAPVISEEAEEEEEESEAEELEAEELEAEELEAEELEAEELEAEELEAEELEAEELEAEELEAEELEAEELEAEELEAEELEAEELEAEELEAEELEAEELEAEELEAEELEVEELEAEAAEDSASDDGSSFESTARDERPSPPRRSSGVSPLSDLVDAPSIGPKTAKRFSKIGIRTIEQFLAADPTRMEARLSTGWINEQLLIDWQDQARLVCEIPSLCGYKAQLLVAVECRTVADLATRDADDLADAIFEFASTKSGERILRSSQPPESDEVQKWIDDAQEVTSRRAA